MLALLSLALAVPTALADGLDIQPAANGLDLPVDAAPSPDGEVIYFVTDGSSGSALFRVEDGEDPVWMADFVHASGVVTSADGETIYVGDSAGGLYAIPAEGGEPELLRGTSGLGILHLDRPHHLLFVAEDACGNQAVYTLPGNSKKPKLLASGLPGTLTGAFLLGSNELVVATVDDDGVGSLLHVGRRRTTTLVEGVELGEPTGMALWADDETLMVSSVSAAGTAQVLLLDVDTGDYSVFDDVIGANTSAGGLHRAEDVYVWAWVDRTGGQVYRLSLE